MKKLISIFLLTVLLAGCGAPTEKADTVSSKAATSSSKSTSSKPAEAVEPAVLITDDEIKEYLIGKTVDCKYKMVSTLGHGVEEKDSRKLEITEITELAYKATSLNESGTAFDVTGTFQATGMLIIDSKLSYYNMAVTTAEPYEFTLSAVRDVAGKVVVNTFEPPKFTLVKPVNPVDLDNLAKYLVEIDPFNDTDCTSIYVPYDGGPLETKAGKVDISSPDLRIVIIEDQYPDPDRVFIRNIYKIEAFNGDEYLCTGYLYTSYYRNEPFAYFRDFPDRLRKLR